MAEQRVQKSKDCCSLARGSQRERAASIDCILLFVVGIQFVFAKPSHDSNRKGSDWLVHPAMAHDALLNLRKGLVPDDHTGYKNLRNDLVRQG